MRRALRELGSKRKEIKYIGLLMFCFLGQNKFEVRKPGGRKQEEDKNTIIADKDSNLIEGVRLCGLVVRVSGYRYRGLGFDSRRYQIF